MTNKNPERSPSSAGAPRREGGTKPLDQEQKAELGRRLQQDFASHELELMELEPLRSHTTLQIGGPADLFIQARTPRAVQQSLAAASELEIPVLLLGGGSNLLASDHGWRGVVLHVACEKMEFNGHECAVEAGADFLEFIFACRDRSLTGLEFAAGVPGSVGGAIYGNAGCYGKAIGEFVEDAVICELDGSNLRTEPADYFEFAYRDSLLKREPEVILSARIRLAAGSREEIQAVIDARLDERRVKHPDWRTEPTAGSYFKNLPPEHEGEQRVPAGRLLDQANCRGLKVGGAEVFSKHANIIVNTGQATAQQVLTLAEVLRGRARKKFGVELEEEVLFVGQKPPFLPHPEIDITTEPRPSAS